MTVTLSFLFPGRVGISHNGKVDATSTYPRWSWPWSTERSPRVNLLVYPSRFHPFPCEDRHGHLRGCQRGTVASQGLREKHVMTCGSYPCRHLSDVALLRSSRSAYHTSSSQPNLMRSSSLQLSRAFGQVILGYSLSTFSFPM